MAGTDAGSTVSLAMVTQGMVGTHRIFRREFPLMPDLIAAVDDGDTDRARVLAEHVRLLLDMVHVHHVAEERYIWDLLPDRAPADRGIVDTMLDQHGEIAELSDRIRDTLATWEQSPDADSAAPLLGAIEQFTSTLVDHAQLEEGAPLPIIAEQLTPAEWGAFVGYASTAMPEEVRGTVMGMMLEDMPDAERSAFLDSLPPPVAERIRTVGAAAYADYVATIRAA